MPYAIHDSETHFIGHEQERCSIDSDLCDLMQTMKLEVSCEKGNTNLVALTTESPANILNLDSNVELKCADSEVPRLDTSREPFYGCAYLQAIRSQFEEYPTTGGEYLDAIFTHRGILHSCPAEHYDCARGFSDLAYLLEKRAWRSDRDADMEAVTAFRHEAWVIASFLPAHERNVTVPKFICVMPMM